MERLLAQIGNLFEGLFALASGGFDSVNQVTGLIIALVLTLMMSSWRSLWATAFGAVIVDRIVMMLRPALDGGAIALPDIMTLSFWMTCLALFLGYAIVIAIFFFIKTILTGTAFRGHRRSHAH
ncbi:hypothetical protein BH10PSE2_BH10PSE2_12330 [soil metagenome]